MDILWNKNTLMSEAIGRFGGDEKIKMTTQNLQKSNAKIFFVNLWKKCVRIKLHIQEVTNEVEGDT